jgi:hypothetical protein
VHRWSIEQGEKKRRPPTADQITFFASKPELDAGSLVLAQAYAQLSTCRQFGMGSIGPIPAWAVWQWEDRNGITDLTVRRHVEAVLAAVDGATLRRANRPRTDGG